MQPVDGILCFSAGDREDVAVGPDNVAAPMPATTSMATQATSRSLRLTKAVLPSR